MKTNKIHIKEADGLDYKVVSALASACDILVGHDPHFYCIMQEYFGDSFLVAVDRIDNIVGWTFGFRSQKEPDLFFLWQIGVIKEMRGRGVGISLLKRLIESARFLKCKSMRATVEVSNRASVQMFENTGFSNISSQLDSSHGHHYIEDFYGEGEAMIILERPI